MRFKAGSVQRPSGAPAVTLSSFLLANYYGNLTVETGVVTVGNWAGTLELYNNPDYQIAYPARANDGSQSFTVYLSGTISAVPSVAFTDTPVTFSAELEHGKGYTLQITVNRALRWALSNVYWDGSKLTFETYGTGDPAKAMYQGLLFKWGSLVGISPVTTPPGGAYPVDARDPVWQFQPGVTPVYANQGNWSTTPYAAIPFVSQKITDPIGPDTDYFASVDGSTLYPDGKGDVCRYIGTMGGPTGYRMPTAYELFYGRVNGVNRISSPGNPTWAAGIAAANSWTRFAPPNPPSTAPQRLGSLTGTAVTMGQGVMQWGGRHGTSTVFPSTGFRVAEFDRQAGCFCISALLDDTADWTLESAEPLSEGVYWSSSASLYDHFGDYGSYSAHFRYARCEAGYNTVLRGDAYAVRCVLDE
jgi:hypothetical protein